MRGTEPIHPLCLPQGWARRVRSAVVQVISLAGTSMAATWGWASDSMNTSLARYLEMSEQEPDLVAVARTRAVVEQNHHGLPMH